MQFVAYEVAAILQSIGSQRVVVQKDFSDAMRLAYLSIFPGTTMYSTDNGSSFYPFGYFPHVWVYYVVGTGENKATVKWYCTTWPQNPSCNDPRYQARTSGQHPESTVKFTSGDASNIHPNLRISKGEVKIIIECTLWYDRNRSFSGSNISCSKVSAQEAFNFLMLSPKAKDLVRADKVNYFTGIAIFTPSSSKMFTESPPSEN